jgi:pilus assembly protein CpaB
MNPRQRRGILLMALAAVGAVAVFFVAVNYVQGISRQVGPTTTAYQFVKPVPRLHVITQADLEEVRVPVRWLPQAAIQSFDTTRGLVAQDDVPAGAVLQRGMVGPPPELQPGQREIAIMINAETGVGGKIQAGDLVDIYATFNDEESKQTQARVIVANARVLAIGALQQLDAPVDERNASTATRFQASEVVPVTFALNVRDSLKITYAESFATKLRLALIAPGTRSTANPNRDILQQRQIFGTPVAARAKR